MTRRTLRASYRDKGRKLGWILGIIGTTIILAFVVVGIVLNVSKRDLDQATGCPTDRFSVVTVVLIDLTDPISPTQAAALRNVLLKVRNEIPQFARLEIYPLKPTTSNIIEPLFAGCNPGSGHDVDSRVYGNPELADRIWKKQFADKVDAVVAEIQKIPPQDSSPLLEGIQSVAVTAFGSPLAEMAGDKRLVIVSDMIHHTSDLSMYPGAPAFSHFKDTQYYLRIKPTLRGAKVDIFLIVRETGRNAQQPPLYKFWRDFTSDSNGFLENWAPLQ